MNNSNDKIERVTLEAIKIDTIKRMEERLRKAMLSSNADELDMLLSPELIFTNHLGQKISKQEDLLAHIEKVFSMSRLDLSQQHILPAGDNYIVNVLAELEGEFNGVVSTTTLRFTRVWYLNNDLKEALDPLLGEHQRELNENGWQVIAGHSSIVC